MAASTWLLLQYAECFAGGFVTSYLLCPRTVKKREEKDAPYLETPEMNILDDGDTTVSVVITEETASKDGSGSLNRKQEQQAQKHNPEGKTDEEEYREDGKKDDKTTMAVSTEECKSNGTFQKIINIQPKF